MSPDAHHPAPVHAVSPQIGRIARLLHLDPSEVHGLQGVPDADLGKSVQVAIDGVPFAVRGIVRKALLG